MVIFVFLLLRVVLPLTCEGRFQTFLSHFFKKTFSEDGLPEPTPVLLKLRSDLLNPSVDSLLRDSGFFRNGIGGILLVMQPENDVAVCAQLLCKRKDSLELIVIGQRVCGISDFLYR